MTTKPLLMGSEVEYSMSSAQSQLRGQGGTLHQRLLDAIRAEHGWLPDVRSPTGIYIDNGSRYYLDSGCHNELSSPEMNSPRQIAVYDRAGEKILLRAKALVKEQGAGAEICITKNNVNFSLPDRSAWGQHEAYTCWIPLDSAAPQLIPHLVSRIPYAGAGCLSAHVGGMGFELSQRARHMTRPTGRETTHDRAIFCTRAWKPSDVSETGWTRTNLISKDSQRCSFGMYLSFGVTGLLLMIMNEGHVIGRGVQLQDPVAAMRAFSLDPWLKTKVPLVGGQSATAIEIQRAYLREARPHIESGKYPDWTGEVLEHWAVTLDQLEADPRQLAERLDTYLKLAMFDHQLSRAGVTWESLRATLKLLEQIRGSSPEPIVRAVLNGSPSELDGDLTIFYDQCLKHYQLKSGDIDRLRFAVRLQALELNYHELGGLFDQMLAAGQVDSVVVTPAEVERAVHKPPPGGRAESRGQLIAKLPESTWACDWQYVVNDAEGKWVDLRDPFIGRRRVKVLTSGFPDPARPMGLDDVSVRFAE